MQKFLDSLLLSWQERVSIWSVPKALQALFFALFSGFSIVGLIFIFGYEYDSVADLFGTLAAIPIISAGLSIVLIEISFLILIFGGGLMVMASWIYDLYKRKQEERLDNKIDKKYGEGTAEQLKQGQNQQSNQQSQT